MADFFETDMYEPIKGFFVKLGYDVNGEVNGCDVVASKDDELIVVEMKKSFNMTLLFQAIDRQKVSASVYVAVPRPKRSDAKTITKMKHVAKSLKLGLIFVAMDSPIKTIDILVFPDEANTAGRQKSARKQRALKEINGRAADVNKGGSTKVKLNTAFKEKNIRLACILERYGEMSCKTLVSDFGFGKEVYSMLSRNYYGWFAKRAKGIYILTKVGADALEDAGIAELTDYYRRHSDPVI